MDLFAIGNILFFLMVMAIWLAMSIIEKRDARRLPPRAHWSGISSPQGGQLKFQDGWICRGCWGSNRAKDGACQRCGAERPIARSAPTESRHSAGRRLH